MRWYRAYVSASVAALLVAGTGHAALPAAGAPSPVGLGIALLDAPVSGANDPRAHLYIVDQLAPGATITRHVRVTNSSPQPIDVSVYPAAASISGGQFRFGDGRASNDLTSWTTVTPAEVHLTAGTSAEGTVRIVVPTDANSGEQYAVIWAQISSTPVTGSGVRQVSRVGVRVYLDVSGTRQPSRFTITQIAAGRDRAGRPQITALVGNTGQRAVDISGTVDLSHGPGSLLTGAVRTDETVSIAPGGTQTVSAEFDPQLPLGPWLVTVKLASGTIANQASATATFPALLAVPVAVPLTRTHTQGWVGWLIGSASVLLILVIVVGLVRRRRSTERQEIRQ